MGDTTVVQTKMEVSDSKPTPKPSSNKVRIVRVEEVEFCMVFVGGVPENKISSMIKVDNGYCNTYKIHAGQDKCDVDSAFYLTSNVKNLFLKPLVPLTIGYANKMFLSHVGDDLSKDTAMTIID